MRKILFPGIGKVEFMDDKSDDPELKQKVLAASRGRGIDGLVEVNGSPRALNQGSELMAPPGPCCK